MNAPERDRDSTGRPRNARSRDALGRPLPRGAESDTPQVPDDLNLPLPEALDLAQHYLDVGQPFHAHEVLESLWKSRPDAERDLWQGLAQIAVGLTHAMRGNLSAAAVLLRRGSGRLADYTGESYGVDVFGVRSAADSGADEFEASSDVRPTAEPLRLRLLRG